MLYMYFPLLAAGAQAALGQLAVAHLLEVEQRPQLRQRLALGTVGARADVRQAPGGRQSHYPIIQKFCIIQV